jgi:hypothetical protein
MNNNFKELTDFLDKYDVWYIIHSDCVEVKGDLWLSRNNIKSLPQSFGNLKIGGSLHLEYNNLKYLPQSFSNLEIGCNLHLDRNKLIFLSDSFGNLKVGCSLYLERNKLMSFPDSFFSSGLYKKVKDIKNLDELHSKFLKQEEARNQTQSQIWVIG